MLVGVSYRSVCGGCDPARRINLFRIRAYFSSSARRCVLSLLAGGLFEVYRFGGPDWLRLYERHGQLQTPSRIPDRTKSKENITCCIPDTSNLLLTYLSASESGISSSPKPRFSLLTPLAPPITLLSSPILVPAELILASETPETYLGRPTPLTLPSASTSCVEYDCMLERLETLRVWPGRVAVADAGTSASFSCGTSGETGDMYPIAPGVVAGLVVPAGLDTDAGDGAKGCSL
jgi:hypothetical protein